MANWYSTSFTTTDKDIVDVIKNGQMIDFYYDEETGNGHCGLRYGLGALDLNKIANIAVEHKSSFRFVSSDIMADTRQTFAFKDGVEVVAKTEHNIVDWDKLMSDDDED